MRVLQTVIIAIAVAGLQWPTLAKADKVPADDCAVERYVAKIVDIYPHSKSSFTQGLLYDSGFIYESTGLYGRSTVQVYSLEMPVKPVQQSLPPQYFGEGLALANGQLVQLTYKSGTGFVYKKDGLQLVKSFRYEGEGWGLAFDGKSFIMSDGSHVLRFLDPETFAVVRRLEVKRCGEPLKQINELEYIDDKLYANIWRTNRIVMIDPGTGEITGEADLSPIANRYRGDGSVNVLNGIAWDAGNKRLFITGKLWPHLYHIELLKQGTS